MFSPQKEMVITCPNGVLADAMVVIVCNIQCHSNVLYVLNVV